MTLERGRVYQPQYVHLSKGSNDLSIPVTSEMSPSVTIAFSFFSNGRYITEGLSFNIPAMHKLLDIRVDLDKKVYLPDETAQLVVKTRDARGAPVPAQMSVGIVDKAIYTLRKSATPAIHSSFYYFRPRQTNASSSLTGMGEWGGGGGGGLGESPSGQNADVLYWNPNVRTDGSGQVTLPVPLLGFKTIWAVQVIGSTVNSDVGQAETEFTVRSDVKGAKTSRRFHW